MRRLLVFAFAACAQTADPAGQGVSVVGTGSAIAAHVEANLFTMMATVDGQNAPVFLDTGAASTTFDRAVIPAHPVTPELVQTSYDVALSLGALNLPAVTITDAVVTWDSAIFGGGVIGANVLSQFKVHLNYRDQTVGFGELTLPDGLQDPSVIPFSLQGSSRIVVRATVEGQNHLLMLDSGASLVTLHSGVFNRLASDGRRQIIGVAMAGNSASSLMRLQTVGFADAEQLQVFDVTATSSANTDGQIEALRQEVPQLDGVLGGNVLREFLTIVDYAGASVELHPYLTRDHIHDEMHRVGLFIAKQAGAFVVVRVVPGTDAERQGVAVGEVIQAIDGTGLGNIDALAGSDLLVGTIGSNKSIEFSTRTLSLRVEEMLP